MDDIELRSADIPRGVLFVAEYGNICIVKKVVRRYARRIRLARFGIWIRSDKCAQLILKQMDAMGTVATAVGARDLTLGLDFLRGEAKNTKMKLLSVNLRDKAGKVLFPASTMVTGTTAPFSS